MLPWYMYAFVGLPHYKSTSQFTVDLPVNLLPMSEITGTWLVEFWWFKLWRQLLVNRKMWVPQRHIEKKNDASLFLAFAACSRRSCCTGCRECEAFNPFYDFVRFETKWTSQPLSPVLNRLRLEMNYELMIWSLSMRGNSFLPILLNQKASCHVWRPFSISFSSD